jgi:perosamine synthetase
VSHTTFAPRPEPYQVLEGAIQEWGGLPHAAVCNTGTAALHLAFESLRLPPGSAVLVPTFAFVACARAVTLAGLTPVFIDCGDDLNIDLCLAEGLLAQGGINPPPSALLLVNTYGRLCDLEKAHFLARKYHLRTVEDCAESHGSVYPPSCSAVLEDRFPDARTWSFYRNKIVCGEEGGAVAFHSPRLADRARSLRSQGYAPGGRWEHEPRGMNYRLTNAQANLILSSLQNVNHNLYLRGRVENAYNTHCPDLWRMPKRDVPWVYDIRIPHLSSHLQTSLLLNLKCEGIEARPGFKPLHTQREYEGHRRNLWGLAERASREVVYLPCGPEVSEESCRKAFEVIRSVTSGL